MMPKSRKKMTTIFLVDTSPFPSPHSRHSIDFVEYHRHRKKEETSHSKVNTRLRMKIAAEAAVVGVYCAFCIASCVGRRTEKLNGKEHKRVFNLIFKANNKEDGNRGGTISKEEASQSCTKETLNLVDNVSMNSAFKSRLGEGK